MTLSQRPSRPRHLPTAARWERMVGCNGLRPWLRLCFLGEGLIKMGFEGTYFGHVANVPHVASTAIAGLGGPSYG